MKILSRVLMGLGATLLFLALLLPTYVDSRVSRAPVDQDSVTVATATGSYYDFEAGEEVTSDQLVSITRTLSDAEASDDEVAVYEQVSLVNDEGVDGEPHLVTASDPSPNRIAIHRVTAEVVDCCDLAPAELTGLVIKWPFGTERRSYPVWDGTLGQAPEAEYVEDVTVDGIPAYVFRQEIPRTTVDTVELMDDDGEPFEGQVIYEATKRYVVEPMTGRILDSQQEVYRAVETPTGEVVIPAADLSVQVTDDTVAENVALARDDTSQLQLVRTTGPVLVGLLGLLVFAGGVVLLRREIAGDDPTPRARHAVRAGS
jgi:hypothetical protein